MKIHNLMEDIVHTEIESVCADMAKDPAYREICTCGKCRIDAACYVLNRVKPRYFASNRGLAREEIFSFERQQKDTDLIAMIFKAFETVAHNRRPNRMHQSDSDEKTQNQSPVFNPPAILGRILNGVNFAPMPEATVSLYLDGKLVAMQNDNWQNPCLLNSQTEGAFTFWPQSITAKKAGEQKIFEFSLHVQADGFEPFQHCFTVPLVSETTAADSISMEKTLKLPSLYMFAPEKDV